MTADNIGNTYSYDAEGRPSKVNNPTQTLTYFDAFNRATDQTRSGVYTQIVYAPSGQKFAIMNGTTLNRYIDPMVAGMAAVHVHGSPDTGYFQHADWLGSSRLAVTGGGAATYDRSYAPFGESYDETATINRNFTGQTEDTTPGLYDFLFRQQSSAQGRWLVPDPAGLAAVDLTNPQTWNRYAYVGNNPLSNVDPLGLFEVVCRIINGVFTCADGGDDDDPGLGFGTDPPFCWRCGGGGPGPSPKPTPTPTPTPSPQPQPINFPNETNGLPNGFPTNPWGVLGAIIPDGADCGDFGPCIDIGEGFVDSLDAYGTCVESNRLDSVLKRHGHPILASLTLGGTLGAITNLGGDALATIMSPVSQRSGISMGPHATTWPHELGRRTGSVGWGRAGKVAGRGLRIASTALLLTEGAWDAGALIGCGF